MSASVSAGRALLRRTVQRPSSFPPRITKRTESTRSAPPSSPPSHSAKPSSPSDVTTSIPGPSWLWLEPVFVPFRAYGRAQRKRPYWTQFFSSLTIYFCGDLSAQSIGEEDYDPKRALRAVTIGGIFSIPSYKWFLYLGEHFNYPSKALSLAVKVLVNQAAFTPLFNSYFFGMQSLLSGASLKEAWDRILHTVPVSWYNSCKLWPAVTAFSFTFVQPQYRSVFAGLIAIGWQTYLSFLNQRAAESEASHKVTHAVETPADAQPARKAEKADKAEKALKESFVSTVGA
ncbi:hypothetical protein BJ546DRAFT_11216 [Cryomyces antarcticus]